MPREDARLSALSSPTGLEHGNDSLPFVSYACIMGVSATRNNQKAIAHLCAADEKLCRLIEDTGPCLLRPRVEHSIFYSLLRAIVYQQLAGKAAATILGRVEALFPEHDFIHPEDVLGASDEMLRAAGLSRNKTAAVRDLAAKTLDGTVPTLVETRRMSDQELIDRLIAIRGIGQWTVEMLLIFRLGRTDVLPLDDYGVQKGFQVTFGTRQLPTKKQMLRRGERWRPYRSVASWYLWRAAEADMARRKKKGVRS
jgi:3-methyladenine DNA glycosylase/8-oxoguanine DNA glycosylase